ncbi:hypothetical protein F4678DRAFT_481887 [Xylaria arbuscula]|nr:hypothetical protein F4678DRAFT_481887 [Xylaria arbuscula]
MDANEFNQFMNEYQLFPTPNYEDEYPGFYDPALFQTGHFSEPFSGPFSDFHSEQPEAAWDDGLNWLAQPSGYDPMLPLIDPASQQSPHLEFEQQDQPTGDGQNWLAESSGTDPGPATQVVASVVKESLQGWSNMGMTSLITSFPTASTALENALSEHTSSSDVGQHYVISKSPFKCRCGKEYTRLFSLERHISDAEKHLVPEYPCPHECTAHQGKNGFRRKDHLVQHLKHFHKYNDDDLATVSRPRQTRKFNIPVCHFERCEYYRGPEFKDLRMDQQQKNRPFDKQSHYTRHMKEEHCWSPYPCKLGCSKLDGKGFFSISALEKHCKEKHPGSTTPVQKPQNDAATTVRCDYCDKKVKPVSLLGHQFWSCDGIVPCRYCGESMKSRHLRDHYGSSCKGEVKCYYCNELMESRHRIGHEKNSCRGEAKCFKCSKKEERRLMSMEWWLEFRTGRKLTCPGCK